MYSNSFLLFTTLIRIIIRDQHPSTINVVYSSPYLLTLIQEGGPIISHNNTSVASMYNPPDLFSGDTRGVHMSSGVMKKYFLRINRLMRRTLFHANITGPIYGFLSIFHYDKSCVITINIEMEHIIEK